MPVGRFPPWFGFAAVMERSGCFHAGLPAPGKLLVPVGLTDKPTSHLSPVVTALLFWHSDHHHHHHHHRTKLLPGEFQLHTAATFSHCTSLCHLSSPNGFCSITNWIYGWWHLFQRLFSSSPCLFNSTHPPTSSWLQQHPTSTCGSPARWAYRDTKKQYWKVGCMLEEQAELV